MRSPISTGRLGNGMEVLVSEEHAYPLVSLQLWVRTGSCDEASLLGSGVSHFLEHMVFKGSSRFSGKELAERMQAMGGSWNAYTSHTHTVFHLDGPASSWRLFLELLVDMVMRPSLPLEELEKEKEVVRREMAMYNDDPDSVFEQLLNQTLYKKHPRKYPILGDLPQFDRLSHSDLCRYHQERYMPNNVFLVVAGDVASEEVLAHADAETKDLSPRSLTPPAPPCEPSQWGSRTERSEFAIPSTKLALAWRIPSSKAPDYPALKVLSHILGNGNSALLYERLHEERGLVYDVSSYVAPLPEGESSFIIEAELAREDREAVRQAILEEMARLSEMDFSVALQRALKQIEMARLRQRSNVNGIASELANSWLGSGQTSSVAEWVEALRYLSSADLQALAKRYFSSERLIEVSLDPIGSNEKKAQDEASRTAPQITERSLPNGLRLVMRPDPRIPICFCELCFMAGAPSESAEKAGINALMADLLMKGTVKRSCTEIAQGIENLGGSLSCNAGNNSILISSTCLKEDLASTMDILADITQHPSFPAEALEREREAMIDEVLESLEDPLALAFLELRQLCFGQKSYGHSISGTPASLASITREDILAQQNKILCASNATLSITGDFNLEHCYATVCDLFQNLPSAELPSITACPPMQKGEKHIVMDKEQAVLALAIPSYAANHPQLLMASIFNEWCRDMAGPLFMTLREESGLAYFVSSSLVAGIDSGMIIFYLGCAPAQLDQSRSLLDAVLTRLAQQGISEEEFERVRSTALAGWLLSQQSQQQIAQTMALDVMLGLPANHFEDQYQNIKNISYTDMQECIKGILASEKNRCLISISPSKRIKNTAQSA